MDRVSRFASPTESSTAARFERLQAERAKKREIMEAAAAADGHAQLVPTCVDMCPEYERLERELHFDVHSFEALNLDSATSSTNYLIDHHKAVKKYHRPAAGNETPLPEDVRTPDCLLRVLVYLFRNILDNERFAFSDRHSFIRDRTRSVRQDLTLQSCRDQRAVMMHEQIARFHIISGHLLCEADPAEFDAFQNTEQLRKVLQSLREMYDDLQMNDWAGEDEFRGYYILTHLQDPTIFRTALEFPDTIRRMEKVRFALEAAVSFHRGDYVKYGQLIREGDYCQAALLHTHLTALRFRGLEIISKAYPAGQSVFHVEEICRLLTFQSTDECVQFLTSHSVSVGMDGMVQTMTPEKPSEPVKPWRLDIIEGKRMAMPLSSLVIQTTSSAPKFYANGVKNGLPLHVKGTAGTKAVRINIAKDVYEALVDFCVPVLLQQIAVQVCRQTAEQAQNDLMLWKRHVGGELLSRNFTFIIDELISEIVLSCNQLQRSSIRCTKANDIYDLIMSELLDECIHAFAVDIMCAERNNLRIKRFGFKLWTHALSNKKIEKAVSQYHNDRLQTETFARDSLLTEKFKSAHKPHILIDLDKCFTFDNALVWLAVKPNENVRYISSKCRVVTETRQCPHLIVCDPEDIQSYTQLAASYNCGYSPYICTHEDLLHSKFDNQIPELANMTIDELEERLEKFIRKCVCSDEYRRKLLTFVQQAIAFLVAQDPSLQLHPDYRSESIYLPSLKEIERQLANMTAGLQTCLLSSQASKKGTPVKHKLVSVLMSSSAEESPVRKLQRVIEESRRSSSLFDQRLAEVLERQ